MFQNSLRAVKNAHTSDAAKLQSASSPLSQASVIDIKGMSKSSEGIRRNIVRWSRYEMQIDNSCNENMV